jgi:hypothetical protein
LGVGLLDSWPEPFAPLPSLWCYHGLQLVLPILYHCSKARVAFGRQHELCLLSLLTEKNRHSFEALACNGVYILKEHKVFPLANRRPVAMIKDGALAGDE